MINHPAIGVPPFMDTSICSQQLFIPWPWDLYCWWLPLWLVALHCSQEALPREDMAEVVPAWDSFQHLLVGGLVAIFYFPIYWEFHHPNWLSYFSEGWPNHQPVYCLFINQKGPFTGNRNEDLKHSQYTACLFLGGPRFCEKPAIHDCRWLQM